MTEDDFKEVRGYDLDSDDDQLEIVDDTYRAYHRPDAVDPEVKLARQAQANRRLFVVLVLTVVAIIGLILINPGGGDESDEELLAGITTLDEANYLFAMEDTIAVSHIRRQFREIGSLLQFDDGVVVNYLFLDRPVEIWVGITLLQTNAANAFNLLLDETDPDLNPDSGWRAQSQFERVGRTITQVVGKGQRHYFYNDSNMIVWVAADSIVGTFALNAVLNTNIRNWINTIGQGGG
ncbi:hypothetical protein ACFL6R_06095 [Gemmatimonadota bacterium]